MKLIKRKRDWSEVKGAEKSNRIIGDKIAEVIGDTFIDHDDMSPSSQWTRIVRMLRHHGINLELFVLDSLDELPLMPFCGLRMDCKAISLDGPDMQLSEFIREFGDGLCPILVKARLETQIGYEQSFGRSIYRFVLLQDIDHPAKEDIVDLSDDDHQPPPIGADW